MWIPVLTCQSIDSCTALVRTVAPTGTCMSENLRVLRRRTHNEPAVETKFVLTVAQKPDEIAGGLWSAEGLAVSATLTRLPKIVGLVDLDDQRLGGCECWELAVSQSPCSPEPSPNGSQAQMHASEFQGNICE